MSYGYQGPPPPFQSQRPPNSFGVPPGTPSAPPSAPPYSHPPTAFGMPQPHSAYPNHSAYPSQPSPYPSMGGGPTMPQPSMPQPSMPYPAQSGYAGQSYPQQPAQPTHRGYPAAPNAQPFSPPNQHSPAHTMSPQQPAYPSSGYHPQSASNTPQNHNIMGTGPYPNMGQSQSYVPSSFPSQSASSIPQNPGSSGGRLYPTLTNFEREKPEPSFSPMHNQHNSSYNPYPGGDYSGGRTNNTSFNYGGSVPYGTPQPAPRMTQARSKLSPTVVCDNFDPRTDAEILRKAMKGFGTDEKAIIQVLAYRTNLQRQEIANQFKTLYGKDLIKDLKSETSGNFENLLVAMMTPLPQFYAKELHDAMNGIGTEECVLIEVMCTMSNHEIRVIKQAYEAMYGKSLEDDLRSDTSGSFERLMVSLCCANRDESYAVDHAAAANEARQLLQAGELRFGTDESTFNAILVQRNIAQLQAVFAEYLNITGHDIEEAISNEFSGDIKKGLLAIVKCVKNRAGFFAEQIYKSMKGFGTQDRRLIRLIVTRSEIDMGEIKQAFLHQYGQTMEAFISDDCSGHYKKCLLALIS